MTESVVERPDNVPHERVVDFDLFNPPGLEDGFHQAWLRLHRSNDAKMLWTFRNGGHWIVNEGKLIHSFYADYERFSARITQVPRERSAGNDSIPATIDPPELVPFRKIVNATLSPLVVMEMQADITKRASELIDELAPVGECEFVSDFALRLPLELFMDYAALPAEDIPQLRYLVEEKMRPSGALSAGEVQERLNAYLEPLLHARRENPGDDLLSRIVTGKVGDRDITDQEARRICAQFLVAGLDTVAAELSFIFLQLARDDKLRTTLAQDPDLLPVATQEFFRGFPLVSRVREVNDDYECDGVMLRRGDLVVIPTMLHGLSDYHFEQAETIDLERRNTQDNTTFGHGPHRCPGAYLARAEVVTVLREWLARIPDFHVQDESAVRFKAGLVASMARLPLAWD